MSASLAPHDTLAVDEKWTRGVGGGDAECARHPAFRRGFGGGAVALVKTPQTETTVAGIAAQYQQASGRAGTVHICAPSGGVSVELIAEVREGDQSRRFWLPVTQATLAASRKK